MSQKTLITGASGFVGRALCADLVAHGVDVAGTGRSLPTVPVPGVDYHIVGGLGVSTDWSDALAGVQAVVHLAARVHVMRDAVADPLAKFRSVNTAGTERLARMAARAGVKRFVFLSSIKVNGEETSPPHPSPLPRGERECFSETDTPDPQDPYAISKWEAEQALSRIAAETGMEVVVLRCPLVYGTGVKGNFLRLMQAVNRGIPLPLALADNRRSLIYLGNLTSAIIACLERREAAGETYLVSDGEDVSIAQLISQMALALGKPSRLWPFPYSLMRIAAGLTGQFAEVDRLFGSLQIDSNKIRHELDWTPAYTLKQGLVETAAWYRRQVQS